MKKLIRLLLGIAILSLFCTCSKKRQVKIEGKVYNPITQEGISGAELWLLKSGSITEYYGGYERVTTVYTAADGSFKVDLKSAKAEILRLGDMHGEYYKIGWYENGALLPSDLTVKKGKTMHADFYAVPYGEYRIKINNINCQGATDTIIINQTNQVNSFLGIDWVLEGCSGYTTAWDKVPMGTIHTKYTVVRSGVSNTYEVDFEVQPNQQNEQVIDY